MIKKETISPLLFYKLLDDANDLITIYDVKKLHITYANKKFLHMIEYTLEELSKKDITKIRKEIDDKNFLDEVLSKNSTTTYANFYSKSGKKYILESNISYYKENNFDYVVCISRDITNKIRVEQELKEKIELNIKEIENQKIFLNTLIQSNPTSIFYKDINGKYLGCNKAWEQLTGIELSSIIGKSVFDIAPYDIAKIYHEQDKKVFNLEENPQIYKSEVYNKIIDKRFNVVFYKSAYFDTNRNVLGLIGVVIDITNITKLEEEKDKKDKLLYHKSKMAAMGEMIENIAHQWRQPLSTISTSASGIKMQKQFDILTDENLINFIDVIVDSSKHLSETIDDFRNFFKKTKDKEKFSIKNALEKALSLSSSKLTDKNIKIIKNIDNIKITSLQNELIHVILNLLNNASDALEKYDLTNKYIFIDCYKKNSFLNIEIKDNAKGIQDEIIDRIFEPYFTTKHQSHGTGIGLYMSQEIVHKHLNGIIEVKNTNYEYKNQIFSGANFIVRLPLNS